MPGAGLLAPGFMKKEFVMKKKNLKIKKIIMGFAAAVILFHTGNQNLQAEENPASECIEQNGGRVLDAITMDEEESGTEEISLDNAVYGSAASLDESRRVFWERLDNDDCHAMTEQQVEFFDRLKDLLDPYLFENKEASYRSSIGRYCTEPVYFGDLEELYWAGQSEDNANPNNVMTLAEAFLFTHPQYFFVTLAFVGSNTKDETHTPYLRVQFLPDFIGVGDRNAARDEIEDAIRSELIGIYGHDAEAAQALHDRLNQRVSYDSHASMQTERGEQSTWKAGTVMYDQSLASVFYDTAEGEASLFNRQTVCAGYSQAMSALSNFMGIPAFSVTSSNHQWNKISVEEADGTWHCVDCTTDDLRNNYSHFLKADFSESSNYIPQGCWTAYLRESEYAKEDYQNVILQDETDSLSILFEGFDSLNMTVPTGGTFRLPAAEKTGYILSAWLDGNTKYGLNKNYINTLSAEDNAVLRLAPKWKAKTFRITYELNGGKKVKGQVYPSSFKGDLYPVIPAPEKEGYVFTGWSDGIGEITENPDFEKLAAETEKILLTAHWEKESIYCVRFFDQDGSDLGYPVKTLSMTESEKTPLPDKTGYIFKGWAKKPNAKSPSIPVRSGSCTIKSLSKIPDKVVDLYAVFTPGTYKISYQLFGGSKGSKTAVSFKGDDKSFTVTMPKKANFTFSGWLLPDERKVTDRISYITGNEDGSYTFEVEGLLKDHVLSGTSLSLTASFSPNTYKVIYDAQGGLITDEKGRRGAVGTGRLRNGVSYLLPSDIELEGKTFLGWAKKPGKRSPIYKTGKPVKDLVKTNNGKITLYAVWK